MQEGTSLRFLVDQLTEGQLEWVLLPPVFDAVVLGEPGSARTYQLYSGREGYFQGLKQQFPGEAAAIEEFERLVKVKGAFGGGFGDSFGDGFGSGHPRTLSYWASACAGEAQPAPVWPHLPFLPQNPGV